MQIDKKPSFATVFPLTDDNSGRLPAQDHAARFLTRMALTRWTRGGDIPHVHASERTMPMRAAWYAQAQAQFQAWLAEGGFQQAEPACRVCALREEQSRAGGDTPDVFKLPGFKTTPVPEEKL